MGGAKSILTNSTPYTLKVKIHQNEKRFKEVSDSETINIDAKIKAIDIITESSVGFGHKSNATNKGNIKYVDADFHGYFTLSPDTSQDISDRVQIGTSNFLSIFLIYNSAENGKAYCHIIRVMIYEVM